MKCAICGRQLKPTTKHHFIGGMPIGPTCYARLDTKKVRIVPSKVIANDQPDLFEDGK
jgi:hypothetical protein